MHNVHVERLHRDVYEGVLSHYIKLFTDVENEGLLDPYRQRTFVLSPFCRHSSAAKSP